MNKVMRIFCQYSACCYYVMLSDDTQYTSLRGRLSVDPLIKQFKVNITRAHLLNFAHARASTKKLFVVALGLERTYRSQGYSELERDSW
jgi:hypothetical protein